MPEPINFLRLYRKRTPLTQADVAFLLKAADESSISRCEKGQREPNLEFILIYHLLFNTSIESFFEYKSKEMEEVLIQRMEALVSEIKNGTDSHKNPPRIKFLEEVIIRLTNQSNAK